MVNRLRRESILSKQGIMKWCGLVASGGRRERAIRCICEDSETKGLTKQYRYIHLRPTVRLRTA